MSTDDELQRVQNARLTEDELVKLTEPHYNQVVKQGELRDNDTIDDRQLKIAQQPVMSAANAVVKLRLNQEQYRAQWAYKDTLRADKWAHKDKVRQMRKERRELVKSRKAANNAAREEQKQVKKATKEKQCRTVKAAKDAKKAAKVAAKVAKKTAKAAKKAAKSKKE